MGENSDYALYYQAVRKSFAASFGKSVGITKAEAAAVPYASIGYRLNDGQEQLLVLATDTGGEQLWTSASHVVLVTRGGRIVRTVGLANNVSAVAPDQGDELPALKEEAVRLIKSRRIEDFPERGAFGIPVTCVSVPKGSQTIVILGRGISTQKVDEVCRSAMLGWSFTDSFWLDPASGLVWRSLQHVGPGDETIEIRVLRPPA